MFINSTLTKQFMWFSPHTNYGNLLYVQTLSAILNLVVQHSSMVTIGKSLWMFAAM